MKLKVPVRATSWVPGLVLVVVVAAGFLIPEPTAVPGGGLDGSGPIGGWAAAAGVMPDTIICHTCVNDCNPAHPESPCDEYCDFPLCSPCFPFEALSGAGSMECYVGWCFEFAVDRWEGENHCGWECSLDLTECLPPLEASTLGAISVPGLSVEGLQDLPSGYMLAEVPEGQFVVRGCDGAVVARFLNAAAAERARAAVAVLRL